MLLMLLPSRVDQLRSESASLPNSRSASPAPSENSTGTTHTNTETRVHHDEDYYTTTTTLRSNNNQNNEGDTNSIATTAVGGARGGGKVPQETLCVYIYPRAELPSVPYKLRFAISPDEWDARVQCVQEHTERAAKPIHETLWFSVFCIAIPVGIAYPLYMIVLDLAASTMQEEEGGAKGGGSGGNTGGKASGSTTTTTRWTREDRFEAVLIPTVVSTLLFCLFLAPMLIRKYVLQRRVGRETRIWEEVDRKKLSTLPESVMMDGDQAQLRWRVRLPYLFSSACVIYIPIPPRNPSMENGTGMMMQDRRLSGMMTRHRMVDMHEEEPALHSRQNSWETDVEAHPGVAGGGGGGLLVRADSFGGQSRFEREERA